MGDVVRLRTRQDTTVEPLWRTVVGARIRQLRRRRGRTLVEVSLRAGISPQYLSELERGLKDPSSEVVAAVAGSLDTTVLELSALAVADLRGALTDPRGPAPMRDGRSGPVLLAA
jgi:transcriptional regulator with XRE-family HTH domain